MLLIHFYHKNTIFFQAYPHHLHNYKHHNVRNDQQTDYPIKYPARYRAGIDTFIPLIGDSVSNGVNGILASGSNALTGLLSGIPKMAQGVTGVFGQTWNGLASLGSGVLGGLSNLVLQLAGQLSSAQSS